MDIFKKKLSVEALESLPIQENEASEPVSEAEQWLGQLSETYTQDMEEIFESYRRPDREMDWDAMEQDGEAIKARVQKKAEAASKKYAASYQEFSNTLGEDEIDKDLYVLEIQKMFESGEIDQSEMLKMLTLGLNDEELEALTPEAVAQMNESEKNIDTRDVKTLNFDELSAKASEQNLSPETLNKVSKVFEKYSAQNYGAKIKATLNGAGQRFKAWLDPSLIEEALSHQDYVSSASAMLQNVQKILHKANWLNTQNIQKKKSIEDHYKKIGQQKLDALKKLNAHRGSTVDTSKPI